MSPLQPQPQINDYPPDPASAHRFTHKFRHDYPVVNRLDKTYVASRYTLPDLVRTCPFPLLDSGHGDIVNTQSEEWFLELAHYNPEKRQEFLGLKAGVLASVCYPDADEKHLRVVADYLNWLFNVDDWTDDYDVDGIKGIQRDTIGAYKDPDKFEAVGRSGRMSKHYWRRALETIGPSCNRRFIQNMDMFFEGIAVQSADRDRGRTPTLEEYIDLRRETSGCYPCLQLEEYAVRIDLPDEVVNNPVIQRMEQSTNDYVYMSNDIFSYNKEQIRNDAHSMIPILMKHHNYDLQTAVDFVGLMCMHALANFNEDEEKLKKFPFSKGVDEMVRKYVDGLRNWIVGALWWSFESERYFYKNGPTIKKTRIVNLLPKAKAKAHLPN